MIRPIQRMGLCSVLLATLLISATAMSGTVATGFEFSGSFNGFTVGENEDQATFTGGEAKSIGNFSLYHSGSNAWMVAPQETGTITFASSVSSITLFTRNEKDQTSALLTLKDASGAIIQQFTPTRSGWLTVQLDNTAIATITLENTGTSGYTVIDDLTYTTAEGNSATPLENPIALAISKGMEPVRLESVATGFTAPVHATGNVMHTNYLYVVDQVGQLVAVRLDTGEKTTILDVSDRLVSLGIAGPDTFDERGLLGIAFHPDFSNNGKLYTYTSEPATAQADFPLSGISVDHQSVIAEWKVIDVGDPTSPVDTASRRELMRIDQPQFNHDGGALAFGPDGMLYISLGDGGNADDQGDGHGELGNGQDTSTILGNLLRINVDGNDSANGQYSIPSDNPFVSASGFLPEIYAYGFRNPYRMSFDRTTGDLYVADVGQNDIEEINLVEGGKNYGWKVREGSFTFNDNGDEPGFVTAREENSSLSDPLAEYDHDEGIAVVGGFVNRGNEAVALAGKYLFGDYTGRLFHLTETHAINEVMIENRLAGVGEKILGFGEDANGTLYLLTNQTGIPSGSTGTVYRIGTAITSGTFEDLVQLVYLAYYGRPADPGGLAFWAEQLQQSNGDLSEIISDFGNSTEFSERFGTLDDNALVNNLFEQMFSRAADNEGLSFYSGLLDSGQTLQQISLDILNGVKNSDTDILANKLAAANLFTSLVTSTGYGYSGNEAAEAAKSLLSEVTTDKDAGLASVQAFFDGL